MKVVTPHQMAFLETQAYRDGLSEADFMEEAGSGVALVVHDYAEKYDLDRHVILLCGKGNNAGDAYVAGAHLMLLDYEVTAYALFPIDDSSPLCRQNYYRFINEGGTVKEITDASEIVFPSPGIIVDGIFGTGFRGEIDPKIAEVIKRANNSQLPIIAVDIPSGLNGETGIVEDEAIVATTTAFLGLPKTGFFLRNGWNYVGKLASVDFGLPQEYIDRCEVDMMMMTSALMQPVMPKLVRNRNKYQAGHVIGLAGSPNYPGAAILSSFAAYRAGAGIVHLLHPDGMQNQLLSSPYELIKVPYNTQDINVILSLMNKANATFIGPGLGLDKEVKTLVKKVLAGLKGPVVIDADALTIIGEEKLSIPSQAVLTPHIGELKRLLQIPEIIMTLDFLWRCRDYAAVNDTVLVIKGGPSFVLKANEPILVNPYGDPGMATAGSGDVLTGVIAALLAQGMAPHLAAALGVYLHGVAGEFAAAEQTSYCMMASDIINCLPDAFSYSDE